MPDVDACLLAIAAARADDPLAPVTVIAPSHVAALQLRRRLAEITPFAGVRFETLPRIAELLGAGRLAAAGREPLARPIGDYVAQQVARESRGSLCRVADLPGYAQVLRQIFRRLRRGGIRSAADVAGDDHSGHLPEVLRLYDRFRTETAAFYDEEDLLEAAVGAVWAGQTSVHHDLGAIYVVPPGAQSSGSAALLSALRDVSSVFIEIKDPRPNPQHRFVLAPDAASEACEVVREVLEALSSGLALHQIAVFHGADPAYRRLLREAFDAANLPVVVLPGLPLSETPAGRAALALALLPERDFSRVAVMNLLDMAPIRDWLPTTGGNVRVLAPLWDRLSRDAGITHGLDRWSRGLDALIVDRETSLTGDRATESEGYRRMLTQERDRARELQAVVAELGRRLESLAPVQPVTTFIPAFRNLVEVYFRPDAEALEEVGREIEQLGTVGAVGGSFSLAAFTQAFAANLELAAVRERNLGDGVIIADYRMAAGLCFQRVILCGTFEGAFPARPGSDTLILDAAWSHLRRDHPYVEDSVLRLERASDAARRAVGASQGTVVWTAPLYEPGGGREYYPSPLMVAAASALDPAVRTATDLRGHVARSWLRRSASPLAGMLVGPTVDPAEVSLRIAVQQRRDGAAVGPGHPFWRPVSLLRARRSGRFTEWDGNLTAMSGDPWLALPAYVSPTSLERYGGCGFKYLCASLLKLKVVEEPEEREVMDAAERGTIIHRILDDFFRRQLSRRRPGVNEPWTDADRAELLAIMEDKLSEADERGLTGLDLFAEHERRTMRSDLTAFLEADTAFRQETGAVPNDFEAPIGEVSIAGVTVRGFVDRIDRTPDGRRAWVVDYKTGSKSEYEAIKEDDAFGSGSKLQLPVYLHAVRDAEEATALYWFITRKGGFERIGYTPTPERQAAFVRTIDSVLRGIAAGAFPAVSGDEDDFYGGFKNCKYCDFDRICSRRRDYEFAAKEGDAGVAPWLNVGRTARGEDPG